MLALYRLGAYIPAPGINSAAVNSIQKNFGGNSILGLLNLFSGGGLGRIAIFALGIMPYITASIILQLLTVVVPSLEKLQKEGEVGQARITQYTRYLTVGLAFAQSIGYVFLFRSFEKSAGATLISNFTLAKVFLIPHASRGTGRRMTEGGQPYRPVRANVAGVIRVIFAAGVMRTPPTIGQLLGQNRKGIGPDIANFFNPQGWHYVLGESLLIIL